MGAAAGAGPGAGRRHPASDGPGTTPAGGGPRSASARPGTAYAFLLDDDPTPLPDPRSLRQPTGVHGSSRVYDMDSFIWTDRAWTGRQLPGSVIYELHIGTFTPGGTFASAIERLDHLVELGVDLVEVLPVNAVDGPRNWGYDGVGWYAVTENYGGPDSFKRFVDACHARRMGVVLDVVYNHLGPSGAYLDRFGPYFAGSNIWGPSINLDGPHSEPVRRFVIDNALMWLRDFHVDGLRLDAVHALHDDRATHLLEQLAVEVRVAVGARGPAAVADRRVRPQRPAHGHPARGRRLRAARPVVRRHPPLPAHAPSPARRQGYYADFAAAGLTGLAHVFCRAFLHEGTWSSFRQRNHGAPVDTHRTPGHRFVAFLQNHDQIGNRATGDRLSETLSPGLLACGAALLLTGPFTPMLFMGEEWGARTPWQFFSLLPGRGAARGRARRGGPRSSASTVGATSRCPTPTRRAPSPTPSWTGTSRRRSRTPPCCGSTGS